MTIVDPARALLARLQRHRGQSTQRRKIGNEPLANGGGVAPGAFVLTGTATSLQSDVQLVEACRMRERHHEVGPGMLHEPFDLAFVIAFAGPTEAILEQVMTDQLGEGAGVCALATRWSCGSSTGLAAR